ncbi:hypothetical protein PIB30_078527 [Stylosanthes scabra]|uniref:Uncharacterized protein n=1 Tax=Stylosanthes scabra TaxID=79078 RepID=A0ABU6XNU1_9FABA|nr:hypothetical protein [Stylosanthes scabra]
MCDGEDEKEIGGMEPSIEKKETSEEDLDEEEDPEEEVSASSSLPMDIDATEDYLQYVEELERRPEYYPLQSSRASVPDSPKEASNRQSNNHDTSSYDLSGVWQAPSSKLLNSLGKYEIKTVQQGAATTCYVALHPKVKGISGEYFSDCNVSKPSMQGTDTDMAKKLWDLSIKFIPE